MAIDTLILPVDHPGVDDPEYRARRAEIAAVSAGATQALLCPQVDYTATEHAIWTAVAEALAPVHEARACSAFRRGADALALPADRVPQLAAVSARLQELAGFHLRAVPGLVPPRTFYERLGRGEFSSTQYLRHPSVPLYTPEPDVIHEVVGHANALAAPEFAELYGQAGRAAARTTSDEALEFFSRVFWFSVEFGVVREGSAWKAFGAGLLSSFGEIQVFDRAEIRPLDIAAMGRLDYDITTYQPVLFGAGSIDEVLDVVGGFFSTYDEDRYWALAPAA